MTKKRPKVRVCPNCGKRLVPTVIHLRKGRSLRAWKGEDKDAA